MSQQDIRRVSLIFLLPIIIIFTCGALMLKETATYAAEFDHNQEMLRRVGYVTAMLEWMPSVGTLLPEDWQRISKLAPFEVKPLSLKESDVRSMHVTDGFPYNAYQYSEELQAVISVREMFSAPVILSCPSELAIVGASFVFLTVALVLCFLLVGNLLSYLLPGTPMYGCVVAAVGILLPIGMGAAMVATMIHTESQCSIHSWMDDSRRSAMLFASLYSLLDILYPTAFPLTLAMETFDSMNEMFIKDNQYSLHVVQFDLKKITPPIKPGHADAEAILLTAAASDYRFMRYFKSSEDVVASYPVKVQKCIFAVLRNVKDEVPNITSPNAKLAFALVLIPQSVVSLIALALFPYRSLGKLSGTEMWQGPWVWRASRRWPLWKLLQAVIVVCFTIGMLTNYVNQLSNLYDVTQVFFTNIRALIEGGIQLSRVGEPLLRSYANLLKTEDWDVGWLKYVTHSTPDDSTMVNHFYQSVFSSLSNYEYTGSSAADEAAKTPPGELPLLANRPDIQAFLRGTLNSVSQSKDLEVGIVAWDISMLAYILTSDVEKMRTGNKYYEGNIVILSGMVVPGGSVAMGGMIQSCLRNVEPYAQIAEAWRRQTGSPVRVAELFNSVNGRKVVQLEQESVEDERARWPSQISYDSTYVFAGTVACIYVLLALVVLGILAIVDYVQMAIFFGCSDGVNAKRGRGVPSNDYTAPASILQVNHYQLWGGVRRASLAMIAIMCLSILSVIIPIITVRNSLDSILSSRIYNDIVSAPVIEDASAAGLMSITTAAWMRAYLSKNMEDIATATVISNEWTTVRETQWADGLPSGLQSSDDDEQQLRDRLRRASGQVSATGTDLSSTSVYDDFILQVQSQTDYFIIRTQYACFNGANGSTQLIKFFQALKTLLLSCIYFQFDDESIEAALEDIEDAYSTHTRCFATSLDELITYINRIIKLRRRTGYFLSRHELSTTLQRTATVATEEAIAAVEEMNVAEPSGALGSSLTMWGPIILAWVATPFVYMVYEAAQRIHYSIYHS